MLKFPPTLIYTWESRTPAEDLSSVINVLSMASSYSVPWEVEILLKFAKVQKQNSSLLQGRSKQNVDAKSSASYFIRQPDIGVCCVVTKDKDSSVDNVFVCTDADVEEKFSNFIHRSLWKASGQRFLIGSCLISVGFIEHAGSAVKPCMEISYCPEDEESGGGNLELSAKTDDELDSIAFQLHKVAIDLLSAHTASHTIPIITSVPKDVSATSLNNGSKNVPGNQVQNVLVTSVGLRARQWLALVAQ